MLGPYPTPASSHVTLRILYRSSSQASWYVHLPLDRPEQAAEILTALFEAARVHGTTIQVQAQPGKKT